MGGSLRVAVLGAPGVGKTAIIRQFLFGDYPERHRPTDGPRLYRPAVLLDGAVYDLSIRDGDVAGPSSSPRSLEEWPDPKEWSLQDTDAFVLVYDICSPDSFDYVKALRQRIAENRRARGPHSRGRQQAGPSAAALRTSSCTGHSSTQGLALRLPRMLSQIQLARAASLPRASALCSSAHTSCASGPTTAGGAASSALQPHVTGMDREIS
ncbi:ras-like protein family member 10A isoform X2 [Microtus oregoni]|uniref:ras-like protein family member 10A isoform X2 n=1 Tax=Microtus oregoni TaxID=111838 RepID=UPI001BB250F7|nr:ras-like protein family member 10A isoform X2 [Microtus oregoni]